ncbi:metallophosphoesterase [Seonamhaeicola marinus]|uniref:Metallophosphoesterase n=1 Tax=Seonamhaeicola marinus TaxID=1912246 RepID=A0A5D0HUF5_9FLAO|nr:metallophosphoesterase [Seonamhaeicola marinus]TYA74531.1 metallophosphoesterase [Seonamhaeicola marinus]
MLRLILILLVFIVLDFYTFQTFKVLFKSNIIAYSYIFVSILILGNFIYQIFTFDRSNGIPLRFSIAFSLLVLFYVPKLFVAVTLFGEDVYRLFSRLFSGNAEVLKTSNYISGRRKFISQIALGVAAVPFASILYGIFKGKYNFKVLKYTLHFEDLPEAFNGYKITQISDIHSGSFDNKDKVSYAVDLINEQKSDVILFTGDMVNNKAEEMKPYINVFSKLKAKDGLYSVLGNHDYGDYVHWKSSEEKQQNLEDLKGIQKEIGFNLLLNEHKFIERNGERLAIVGVENWGAGGFKKAGDLKKAATGIDKNDFKILLSHDPSHWEKEVVKDDYHYHLTLSGHTHGMQFGIEIPGWFKWSPVKWRYKYWAGIYEELGQFINVNRGFGYLAFPGRVGIWPEITVIELKKGTKPA